MIVVPWAGTWPRLIGEDVGAADVVVIGPGLDDAEGAADLVVSLLPAVSADAYLLLDAFALSQLASWYHQHELPPRVGHHT